MPDLIAHAAGRSDRGRVREVNEDRVLLLDDAGRGASLYAIADGLGGHAGGDVASTLAVETLRSHVQGLLAQRLPPHTALVDAVRRANAAIYADAQGSDRPDMATTCSAVLLQRGEMTVAHVGDSRVYLLRGPETRQLTVDHSLAGELARHGALAGADVRTHAQRHVLTRALGVARDVQIDSATESLRPGDMLVLTTDGLHNAVPPDEMGLVVRTARQLDEACETLVGLANARGGVDNASAVVVRVSPRWPGRALRILTPLALAVFVAGGLAAYRLEHAYFLGIRGDRVAVMRGVPGALLGMPLSAVMKVTQVPVTQIAPGDRGRLSRGIPTSSPEAAESMLQGLLSAPTR
jgi:serine/threonine protein phosphatase PrpC